MNSSIEVRKPSRIRLAFGAAALASTAVLGACTGTVPVVYSPSSSMSAAGTVDVGDFAYLPAKDGKVKPNQLKNTAMGQILLDHNIDEFFRDGVFKELRFMGVKVSGGNKRLTGEIRQFLVDDLGYSVDWTVDVDYKVTDATTGAVVYESDKVTKNHTAKFANQFAVLNAQITSSVEALVKDPDFLKAIN